MAFTPSQKRDIKRKLLNPRKTRRKSGMIQTEFWGQYSVTQSGGSRYENERTMPEPLQLLMALHLAGKFDGDDLQAARKLIKGAAQSGS